MTPTDIRFLIEQNRARREPVLDLSDRSLLRVPPEIRQCSHLEQLVLRQNYSRAK